MRALLPALLWLPLLVGAARAGEGPTDGPEENTSFVQDEAEAVERARRLAEEALARDDPAGFVRAWQSVVEMEEAADDPGAAAPYVIAVRGKAVFEGAWRVAHHRILAAGEAALEAYARQYGALAAAGLERALARRDPEGLTRVADRFLPLPEGRQAALFLADLALEAGDRDGALAWLERLEDLEEVTTEPEAALAPWRAARIARMALALARPDAGAEARRFLAEATGRRDRFPALPPRLRPARRPESEWTTTGGAPDRAGLAPAVPPPLAPHWQARLSVGEEEGVGFGAPDGTDGRPSPWIAPRAVTDGRHVFVHGGEALVVLDAENGRRVATVGLGTLSEVSYGEEQREVRGLIEGHSLTLGPRQDGVRLLYAAVADGGDVWGNERDPWSYGRLRDDALLALAWDGRRLVPHWRIGTTAASAALPEGSRLYGAPLLYRDRLWIAAIRPLKGSSDQAEAWLLGLDPWTGAVVSRTWLCAGPPVRGGRPDEAIPSSPAGAAGRVVVSTSLGAVVAVDARHGRVHWALRYDRGAVSSGRPRRLEGLRDATPRQSGFENQPPLVALERTFVAPTDGPHLLFLLDRPRGPDRALVLWRLHRRFDFPLFAVEQVVGLDATQPDGTARLVLAGKGASPEGGLVPPMVVTLDALAPLDGERWRGVSTTGLGAETRGRALLTTEEVIVPTARALVVYALVGGKILQTADAGGPAPPGGAVGAGSVEPVGNLVPVPGVGILAVGQHAVTLWKRRPR